MKIFACQWFSDEIGMSTTSFLKHTHTHTCPQSRFCFSHSNRGKIEFETLKLLWGILFFSPFLSFSLHTPFASHPENLRSENSWENNGCFSNTSTNSSTFATAFTSLQCVEKKKKKKLGEIIFPSEHFWKWRQMFFFKIPKTCMKISWMFGKFNKFQVFTVQIVLPKLESVKNWKYPKIENAKYWNSKMLKLTNLEATQLWRNYQMLNFKNRQTLKVSKFETAKL